MIFEQEDHYLQLQFDMIISTTDNILRYVDELVIQNFAGVSATE